MDKKWGAPTITKDGVTVAKEVDLQDPFEPIRQIASNAGIEGSVVIAATAVLVNGTTGRELLPLGRGEVCSRNRALCLCGLGASLGVTGNLR